jgi:HEAT repeat protein
MTTSYCPQCWQAVAGGSAVCEHCRAPLAETGEGYLTKLVAALSHPDYVTRRRAAFVLGWLRDGRAREPLLAKLFGSDDPYVRAEAAASLAAIGGPEAEAALLRAAADPGQSVIVRRAAQDALVRARRRDQSHACQP